MAQNINTYIQPAFTLAAQATANLDIRLTDITDIRISLAQTWSHTATSATGILANLYPGFGGKDPLESILSPIPHVLTTVPTGSSASYGLTTVPQFANNFDPVNATSGYTAIVQPTTGSNSTQTTTTVFFLNTPLIKWSQWVRLQVINLDPTNSCTITVNADL